MSHRRCMPGDDNLAKQSLVLIEARGFARGKRLMEEFEQLVTKVE